MYKKRLKFNTLNINKTKTPDFYDQAGWKSLCYDNDPTPSTKLLMSMDESTTAKVFQYYTGWIQKAPLTRLQSQWVFAFLTFLDIPYDDDTSASLRSLLLKLCEERASLVCVKS